MPYSKPKLSYFYTPYHTKLLGNYNLHSGRYPYRLYLGVPSSPPPTPLKKWDRRWEVTLGWHKEGGMGKNSNILHIIKNWIIV